MRVGLAGHVARMGATKQKLIKNVMSLCLTKLMLEKLKGRDHSKDLSVDGKIILEWNLGKCGGKVRIELIWLRMGTSNGLL
jgi:hypothetical protein